MSDRFASATMIQRRQMIEDALAIVLRRVGEIGHGRDEGRCLTVVVRRCEDVREFECYSLWDLASELEVLLA